MQLICAVEKGKHHLFERKPVNYLIHPCASLGISFESGNPVNITTTTSNEAKKRNYHITKTWHILSAFPVSSVRFGVVCFVIVRMLPVALHSNHAVISIEMSIWC